jgi:hypothetical protein
VHLLGDVRSLVTVHGYMVHVFLRSAQVGLSVIAPKNMYSRGPSGVSIEMYDSCCSALLVNQCHVGNHGSWNAKGH